LWWASSRSIGRLVGVFAHGVELAVQRQDQRDVLGDAQILRRDGDALRAQLGDLVEEGSGIEHHAIADHRELLVAQHARRQQRELVGLAVDHQRVAGVMTALEADDDVRLLRQPVDDLALSFVAPLGADDDNIGHSRVILRRFLCRCHDPNGKLVPTFPESCLRPAQFPAQGRSHARRSHRIKEAAPLGKQEPGFFRAQSALQAFDIP